MAKYKLEDIAPIQQGIIPKCEKYWLLNLDMIESNTGKILDYLYVSPEEIGASTVTFDTDNVLYSKLRPYLNKVVLPDRFGYSTSEMLPFRPNTRVITREYLTYFLRSPHFVSYINEKTSGAKMPRANSSDLRAVEIECPAIEKQEKITTIFDRIVSIIDFRKKQLQTLDDLVKARFVEMFGDVEYPLMKMKDLSEIITKGTTPTTAGYEFLDKGINFFKIESILDDHTINHEKVAHVSEECHKAFRRSQLKAGDILFSIAGAIGRTAIISEKDLPGNTNQALAIIRLSNSFNLSKRYLISAFESPLITEQYNKKKRGIAQINLSLEDIGNLHIPIPDQVSQDIFEQFALQVDKSKLLLPIESTCKRRKKLKKVYNIL